MPAPPTAGLTLPAAAALVGLLALVGVVVLLARMWRIGPPRRSLFGGDAVRILMAPSAAGSGRGAAPAGRVLVGRE